MKHEYIRYLLAKRTVDDRALNRLVADAVRTGMDECPHRPRVLELGAGVGTMVARVVDWQILKAADYVVLDSDLESLSFAREWLASWAAARGFQVESRADGMHVSGAGDVDIDLRIIHTELGAFLDEQRSDRFDLIVANAVLDLVDLPRAVPHVLSLLASRGIYWFSVNFDGETIFLPENAADAQILSVYHESMNQRTRVGMGGGDSRTGRKLFGVLRASGARIDKAGSSDWVVFAGADGYVSEERYFLEYILHTIQSTLSSRPVAAEVVQRWMETRHAQLARGELVYIAHQLDLCGGLQQAGFKSGATIMPPREFAARSR